MAPDVVPGSGGAQVGAEVDASVRYGAEPEQLVDVRLSVERPPRALVVLVHGGFWREAYDRHHTDPIAADLALHGYAVASLEYRRVGGSGGWPQTFDDIAGALDRLPALLQDAIPPAAGIPVVLLGHSAGGHLALWAAGRQRLPATSRWHLPTPPDIAGVVALAPVGDLAYAHELDLDGGAVAELLGGPGPNWADRLEQADPSGLRPAAPVVVVHGDLDRHVPLEVARRYVDSVRALGADATLDVVVGAEHFALIDPTSAAWLRVLAALGKVCGRA